MISDSFQRALDLIEVDRFFEAIALLNNVIAEDSERAEAYVQRAKVRRRLGDGEGAIADYSQAIKLAPMSATYLARALMWLSLDEVKGAINDSREALKLQPELAGGHRLLGKALGLLGDGSGAIAAYKQAARCYLGVKDKTNAQACLDAIRALRSLPNIDFSKAPQSGSKAASFTGDAASIHEFMRRVQVKYDASEYALALKDVNWLLDCDANQVQALCLRGSIQAQLGHRDLAIADLSRAKQLSSGDREVQFCQGQIRLILQDSYGAIEEFSALIESVRADANPVANSVAKYFVARGRSYQLVREQKAAFEDYSEAIAIDTKNAALYELRAHMQQSMNDVDGAIADFQKAATLWLNQGNWKAHQSVVESVRQLRQRHLFQHRDSIDASSTNANSAGSKRNSSTVPIKHFSRHMPVVEVLFDGIAAFDIVIDRKATHSIVTEKMAAQLKLEPVSYRYVYLIDGTPMELSLGRLRSVKIGGTVITDVYVAIAPDKETAVLGKNCFSAYSVRISGNEITFLRR